jgi:hypothetical protein
MSLNVINNYLPVTLLNEFVSNDPIDKLQSSTKEPQQSLNVKNFDSKEHAGSLVQQSSPIEEFWIELHRQVARKEEKPSYETLEKLIQTLKQRGGSGNLRSEDLLFFKKLAEKYKVSCPIEEWQQLFWKSYSATHSKL